MSRATRHAEARPLQERRSAVVRLRDEADDDLIAPCRQTIREGNGQSRATVGNRGGGGEGRGQRLTGAVQEAFRRMRMPNFYDYKTWDLELIEAFAGVREVDGEKVKNPEPSSGPARQQHNEQEKAANAAVQRLVSWATTHFPELGPLDYGVPRSVPLEPIQGYKGKYADL